MLIHLGPFEATGTDPFGFTWITGILNSEYSEDVRHEMASGVVQPLGKRSSSGPPMHPPYAKSAWIPPFLDFLLLCEKFYTEVSLPPHSRFIALHILSTSRDPVDFVATILPVLAPTLLQSHPLQSRGLSLKVFRIFVSGCFFPQMENVLNRDLNNHLRAVDVPFQHPG